MKTMKYLGIALLMLGLGRPALAVPVELAQDDYIVATIPQSDLEEISFFFTKLNENDITSLKLEEGEVITTLVLNKNTLQPYDVSAEALVTGNGGLMVSVKDPDVLNSLEPSLDFESHPTTYQIAKNANPGFIVGSQDATFGYVKSNILTPMDDLNQVYEFTQIGGLKVKIKAVPPVCGNSVVETGEECDDGNQVDDDECSNACSLTEEQPPVDPDNGGCSLSAGAGSSAGLLSFALSFLALGAIRLRKNS